METASAADSVIAATAAAAARDEHAVGQCVGDGAIISARVSANHAAHAPVAELSTFYM